MAKGKEDSNIMKEIKSTQDILNRNPHELDDDEIDLAKLGKQTGYAGPNFHRAMQSKVDEVAIDEMLMSVPKNEGYYMRLWKENPSTNRWEYKDDIKDFHNIADLPQHISNVIRKRTAKAPLKWGSGVYKLDFWKEGGIRGDKYKEIVMDIDAQEELLPNNGNNGNGNNSAMNNNGAEIAGILAATKDYADPEKVQNLLSNAFTKGIEAAGNQNKGDNGIGSIVTLISESNKMMMTMILESNKSNAEMIKALVGNKQSDTNSTRETLSLLKELGIVGGEKKDDLTNMVEKLTTLGLLRKPSDPMDEIKRMSDILSLVKGIGGGDREKSTIEVIADSLGAYLPKVLETVDKTIALNQRQLDVKAQAIPIQQTPPIDIHKSKINPQRIQPEQSAEQKRQEQVTTFMNQLKEAIEKQDENFFKIISIALSSDASGKGFLELLKAGTLGKDELVKFIKEYGTPVGLNQDAYNNPIMVYAEKYIAYLKQPIVVDNTNIEHPTAQNNSQSMTTDDIIGKCNKCNESYKFDSLDDYNNDSKKCELIVGTSPVTGNILCEGNIILELK